MKKQEQTRAQSTWAVIKKLYAMTVAFAALAAWYILYFQSRVEFKVIAVVLLSYAVITIGNAFLSKDK